MNRLTIRKPDDWHLHLRDRPYLDAVVADTAAQFKRAIVMPNLTPPVRSCADAAAYRERILAALPEGSGFEHTCGATRTVRWFASPTKIPFYVAHPYNLVNFFSRAK